MKETEHQEKFNVNVFPILEGNEARFFIKDEPLNSAKYLQILTIIILVSHFVHKPSFEELHIS